MSVFVYNGDGFKVTANPYVTTIRGSISSFRTDGDNTVVTFENGVTVVFPKDAHFVINQGLQYMGYNGWLVVHGDTVDVCDPHGETVYRR